MRTFKIEYKRSALKNIKILPREMEERIRSAIDNLSGNPRPHGSRKISGAGEDRYRVKVGDYRVIYRIYNDYLLVLILRVAHRREAYRDI